MSPNANAGQAAAAGTAGYKRARSEEGEAPELVQLRKRNEVGLFACACACLHLLA